ncbi:MAG: rod shape-determining protein MreC [Acidimicrobiia bacterium]|nr:rod shape-determining protein MreC [Acidimicrobiia bacterium]
MFPTSGRRLTRATILFLSLVAIGFIIATFDVRSEGDSVSNVMREGTQSIFTPLQKGARWVASPVIGFVDGVANLAGLRDENERLQARVTELEAESREVAAIEEQVRQLEAIVGIEAPEELPTVTARLFSSGPTAFDNVRFIDKGANDGIVAGQAVIDENGLVGRVDLVSANDARIRLIIDPLVSAGVRVQSTNETGIVTGRGDGPLRLEMFRATKAVYEGDLVVTDGSRFPPGLVVGRIAETADADVGFILSTTVDPAARLSEVDYVKVIIGWTALDADLRDGVVDTSVATTTTTVPTTTTLPTDSGE